MGIIQLNVKNKFIFLFVCLLLTLMLFTLFFYRFLLKSSKELNIPTVYITTQSRLKGTSVLCVCEFLIHITFTIEAFATVNKTVFISYLKVVSWCFKFLQNFFRKTFIDFLCFEKLFKNLLVKVVIHTCYTMHIAKAFITQFSLLKLYSTNVFQKITVRFVMEVILIEPSNKSF